MCFAAPLSSLYVVPLPSPLQLTDKKSSCEVQAVCAADGELVNSLLLSKTAEEGVRREGANFQQ